MTGYIERVLIVLNGDGSIKGVAAYDERGSAAPLTPEALIKALPDHAVLLARMDAADAEAVKAAMLQRQLDDMTAERDALQSKAGDTKAVAPEYSVSPLQAKMALLNAGLLDEVEATVANSSRDVQLAWTNAQSFERNSPLIASLSSALGLSAQQIDDLFALAATL